MTQNRISNAGPNDCVAGRGGFANNHDGTIAYRAFVDERYLDYRWWASNNQQKQQIRDERIRNWKSQGGRFLKGDQCSGFFIMTAKEEKKKTSQRLRERPELFFDNFFGSEKDKEMTPPEEPGLYSEQSLYLMRAPVSDFEAGLLWSPHWPESGSLAPLICSPRPCAKQDARSSSVQEVPAQPDRALLITGCRQSEGPVGSAPANTGMNAMHAHNMFTSSGIF